MGNLAQALDQAASTLVDRLLAHLPQLLGALALLLAGWLLARLLRLATRRGAALLESLLARSTGRARWQIGRSALWIGSIVYWIVLLFFITAALHTLGLQSVADWLARLLDHLPTLAAGLLIVFAGYLLSGVVGELVHAAAQGSAPAQRRTLARVAKWTTLVLALLIGADQIGLKVTWLAIFVAVLVGSLLGGLALAVSLGARHYVANLIGAHHLRQALRIGQRIRVAGHEGTIVDLGPTSLVLETADGRVLLPGRVFHDDAIVVIVRGRGRVGVEAADTGTAA